MFNAIRKKHPTLPVIMMPHPFFSAKESNDEIKREQVVKQTYENALKKGDKNVYFINGKTFFGKDLYSCTVDSIHPNDLGFYFMAKKLIPVIKKALKQKQDKN